MPDLRTLIVIPARLEAQRLPRKLLLPAGGKPVLAHTWERARQVGAERVVIATDCEEIQRAAREFGAEAVMTSVDHQSGTDRVAEAVRRIGAGGGDDAGFELVVNVQGDEPELEPEHLEALIELMARSDCPMGTLAEPITDPADLARPQAVKLVRDQGGRALYFSRAPIPSGAPAGEQPLALRHLGTYAYRPAFLQEFCRLPRTPLEQRERLEQLRALEHGHRIAVAVVQGAGARGIDTPEDYEAFLARLSGGAGARLKTGLPNVGPSH